MSCAGERTREREKKTVGPDRVTKLIELPSAILSFLRNQLNNHFSLQRNFHLHEQVEIRHFQLCTRLIETLLSL